MSELIVLFERRSHLANKAENRFSSRKIEVLTGDLRVSLDKSTLEYNIKSVETSYHISIISMPLRKCSHVILHVIPFPGLPVLTYGTQRTREIS